ncbi:hypothetical protein AMJ85_08235 [candidate division BRC1 bacterium SM23_51]|nr:MAG: hypothetical protein AMJ85_08235 [candidate division BRC1 bacterium SM23_51]
MGKVGSAIYIVVILAVAVCAGGCRPGNKTSNPGERDDPRTTGTARVGREYAAPVVVRKLVRRPMSEYVSTVGTVAPARSLAVKSEESGRISFVKPWREGDFVKKGEMLARLDEEETSRAIEITRADLETANRQLDLELARVERTSTDFDRAKVMYNLGQISRKVYEEREFQAQSAQISYDEGIIRVERAEKTLERLLIQMDRKIVRATMSGHLVRRAAIESRSTPAGADSAESITDLEGQLVGTGSTICGIVDTSEILLRCDVTSKDISKVRKGQQTLASVYSDQEIAIEGKVVDVSPIMDVQTRAFKVDIAVANPEGRLRPGMFARVNIIIQTHRDTLVVDRKVLQRRNNQDILFVVGPQERAELREVTLGLENPDQMEILEGLAADEQLVVLGYETLQDKVKVKIIDTEPAVAEDDSATTSVSATGGAGGRV